ncbi:hypothetical protein KKA47_02320, partial [bacterium]|nr:hypothetical protein [bacterium]
MISGGKIRGPGGPPIHVLRREEKERLERDRRLVSDLENNQPRKKDDRTNSAVSQNPANVGTQSESKTDFATFDLIYLTRDRFEGPWDPKDKLCHLDLFIKKAIIGFKEAPFDESRTNEYILEAVLLREGFHPDLIPQIIPVVLDELYLQDIHTLTVGMEITIPVDSRLENAIQLYKRRMISVRSKAELVENKIKRGRKGDFDFLLDRVSRIKWTAENNIAIAKKSFKELQRIEKTFDVLNAINGIDTRSASVLAAKIYDEIKIAFLDGDKVKLKRAGERAKQLFKLSKAEKLCEAYGLYFSNSENDVNEPDLMSLAGGKKSYDSYRVPPQLEKVITNLKIHIEAEETVDMSIEDCLRWVDLFEKKYNQIQYWEMQTSWWTQMDPHTPEHQRFTLSHREDGHLLGDVLFNENYAPAYLDTKPIQDTYRRYWKSGFLKASQEGPVISEEKHNPFRIKDLDKLPIGGFCEDKGEPILDSKLELFVDQLRNREDLANVVMNSNLTLEGFEKALNEEKKIVEDSNWGQFKGLVSALNSGQGNHYLMEQCVQDIQDMYALTQEVGKLQNLSLPKRLLLLSELSSRLNKLLVKIDNVEGGFIAKLGAKGLIDNPFVSNLLAGEIPFIPVFDESCAKIEKIFYQVLSKAAILRKANFTLYAQRAVNAASDLDSKIGIVPGIKGIPSTISAQAASKSFDVSLMKEFIEKVGFIAIDPASKETLSQVQMGVELQIIGLLIEGVGKVEAGIKDLEEFPRSEHPQKWLETKQLALNVARAAKEVMKGWENHPELKGFADLDEIISTLEKCNQKSLINEDKIISIQIKRLRMALAAYSGKLMEPVVVGLAKTYPEYWRNIRKLDMGPAKQMSEFRKLIANIANDTYFGKAEGLTAKISFDSALKGFNSSISNFQLLASLEGLEDSIEAQGDFCREEGIDLSNITDALKKIQIVRNEFLTPLLAGTAEEQLQELSLRKSRISHVLGTLKQSPLFDRIKKDVEKAQISAFKSYKRKMMAIHVVALAAGIILSRGASLLGQSAGIGGLELFLMTALGFGTGIQTVNAIVGTDTFFNPRSWMMHIAFLGAFTIPKHLGHALKVARELARLEAGVVAAETLSGVGAKVSFGMKVLDKVMAKGAVLAEAVAGAGFAGRAALWTGEKALEVVAGVPIFAVGTSAVETLDQIVWSGGVDLKGNFSRNFQPEQLWHFAKELVLLHVLGGAVGKAFKPIETKYVAPKIKARAEKMFGRLESERKRILEEMEGSDSASDLIRLHSELIDVFDTTIYEFRRMGLGRASAGLEAEIIFKRNGLYQGRNLLMVASANLTPVTGDVYSYKVNDTDLQKELGFWTTESVRITLPNGRTIVLVPETREFSDSEIKQINRAKSLQDTILALKKMGILIKKEYSKDFVRALGEASDYLLEKLAAALLGTTLSENLVGDREKIDSLNTVFINGWKLRLSTYGDLYLERAEFRPESTPKTQQPFSPAQETRAQTAGNPILIRRPPVVPEQAPERPGRIIDARVVEQPFGESVPPESDPLLGVLGIFAPGVVPWGSNGEKNDGTGGSSESRDALVAELATILLGDAAQATKLDRLKACEIDQLVALRDKAQKVFTGVEDYTEEELGLINGALKGSGWSVDVEGTLSSDVQVAELRAEQNFNDAKNTTIDLISKISGVQVELPGLKGSGVFGYEAETPMLETANQELQAVLDGRRETLSDMTQGFIGDRLAPGFSLKPNGQVVLSNPDLYLADRFKALGVPQGEIEKTLSLLEQEAKAALAQNFPEIDSLDGLMDFVNPLLEGSGYSLTPVPPEGVAGYLAGNISLRPNPTELVDTIHGLNPPATTSRNILRETRILSSQSMEPVTITSAYPKEPNPIKTESLEEVIVEVVRLDIQGSEYHLYIVNKQNGELEKLYLIQGGSQSFEGGVVNYDAMLTYELEHTEHGDQLGTLHAVAGEPSQGRGFYKLLLSMAYERTGRPDRIFRHNIADENSVYPKFMDFLERGQTDLTSDTAMSAYYEDVTGRRVESNTLVDVEATRAHLAAGNETVFNQLVILGKDSSETGDLGISAQTPGFIDPETRSVENTTGSVNIGEAASEKSLVESEIEATLRSQGLTDEHFSFERAGERTFIEITMPKNKGNKDILDPGGRPNSEGDGVPPSLSISQHTPDVSLNDASAQNRHGSGSDPVPTTSGSSGIGSGNTLGMAVFGVPMGFGGSKGSPKTPHLELIQLVESFAEIFGRKVAGGNRKEFVDNRGDFDEKRWLIHEQRSIDENLRMARLYLKQIGTGLTRDERIMLAAWNLFTDSIPDGEFLVSGFEAENSKLPVNERIGNVLSLVEGQSRDAYWHMYGIVHYKVISLVDALDVFVVSVESAGQLSTEAADTYSFGDETPIRADYGLLVSAVRFVGRGVKALGGWLDRFTKNSTNTFSMMGAGTGEGSSRIAPAAKIEVLGQIFKTDVAKASFEQNTGFGVDTLEGTLKANGENADAITFRQLTSYFGNQFRPFKKVGAETNPAWRNRVIAEDFGVEEFESREEELRDFLDAHDNSPWLQDGLSEISESIEHARIGLAALEAFGAEGEQLVVAASGNAHAPGKSLLVVSSRSPGGGPGNPQGESGLVVNGETIDGEFEATMPELAYGMSVLPEDRPDQGAFLFGDDVPEDIAPEMLKILEEQAGPGAEDRRPDLETTDGDFTIADTRPPLESDQRRPGRPLLDPSLAPSEGAEPKPAEPEGSPTDPDLVAAAAQAMAGEETFEEPLFSTAVAQIESGAEVGWANVPKAISAGVATRYAELADVGLLEGSEVTLPNQNAPLKERVDAFLDAVAEAFSTHSSHAHGAEDPSIRAKVYKDAVSILVDLEKQNWALEDKTLFAAFVAIFKAMGGDEGIKDDWLDVLDNSTIEASGKRNAFLQNNISTIFSGDRAAIGKLKDVIGFLKIAQKHVARAVIDGLLPNEATTLFPVGEESLSTDQVPESVQAYFETPKNEVVVLIGPGTNEIANIDDSNFVVVIEDKPDRAKRLVEQFNAKEQQPGVFVGDNVAIVQRNAFDPETWESLHDIIPDTYDKIGRIEAYFVPRNIDHLLIPMWYLGEGGVFVFSSANPNITADTVIEATKELREQGGDEADILYFGIG